MGRGGQSWRGPVARKPKRKFSFYISHFYNSVHAGSGTLLIYVKYEGLSSGQVWPYRYMYGDGILSLGDTKDGNSSLKLIIMRRRK